MPDLFIVLTGAYGNVGDGVIRRRVLDWVRSHGTVHAYVGNAPDDWVEQLGLDSEDRVYSAREARAWITSLAFSRGPAALVLDPGQIPLGKSARRAELLYLVLTTWARLRGRAIIRPPRAFAREVDRVSFALHRIASTVSSVALWRTPRCAARIGVGDFCPDTAFQETFVDGIPLQDRTEIVVSMRGRRNAPSPQWFDMVGSVATAQGASVKVLSQVREDEARGHEIVEALLSRGTPAEMLAWGDRSDLAQEQMVRTRYEAAKYVISDRLHVLILAAKAGAVPIELTDQHPSKAEEHFGAIGYDGISLLVAEGDSTAGVRHAEDSAARVAELQRKMREASDQIDLKVSQIRAALSSSGLRAPKDQLKK